jgi:proteasome lid subunit RPN8/RPN11
VYEVIEQRVGEWTIYTDTWFLRRVQQLRENKLPNETGGLLIGAFDMERKIIYVVDTIPSTPDSLEWPTTYIRGCEGLLNSVKEVRAKTADNLEYVGEWHSHPFGCQASLSADDVKALEWLRGMMNSQGLPAFMLIVGNAGERSWNIAEPA